MQARRSTLNSAQKCLILVDTLRFPADRSVGEFSLVYEGESWLDALSRVNGEAQGDVTIPPGMKMRLLVSKQASADLSFLGALAPSDITGLRLTGKAIADAGLVHLRGLTRLEELDLADTRITDAGLVHLRHLTGLKELWLRRTKVTDWSCDDLKRFLPNLEIF